MIDGAARILEFTLSTFPGGTDHTFRHTTSVEVIGGLYLPDDFLAAMSPEELFFLTTACHYHDLAMAGTEADDRSAETREQVRRDHAIRVGEKIRERWAELGFDDPRIAQVLGEVCRGHRPQRTDGEANWEELNPVEVLNLGVSVRVRLVAALIYALDELHLGADRAPARVQSWREIRDEEDRRHWRRHQAVHGPVRTPKGCLLFQLNADTPSFEESLRSQVFRKALGALRDLGRQAGNDGVTVSLPEVQLQWNREAMWRLLLPMVCSDLRPRTREEIEQQMLDRYASESHPRTDLSGLCSEIGNSEDELRQTARRCVSDAISFRWLTPTEDDPKAFILASGESVGEDLFGRARDADELDRLYRGRYSASWEERLFESAYGRDYVRNCVFPAVDNSYSVFLTQRPPNDPLRVLIERCPAAARMVREFRPAPSNLVKVHLLRQAAITGALFDLHANPDRILNRELRSAVREITQADPALTADIRLVEELALVGGLTTAQVNAAQSLSDEERRILAREAEATAPGFTVTVSQQVPVEAPASTSHLPRMLLASRRSNTRILLASAPDHRLDIRVSSDGPIPPAQPIMIEVGPAVLEEAGPGYLPARIELSRPSRTLRFYLGRFESGPRMNGFPFLVRVPTPPSAAEKRATVSFGAHIQWQNLTVRDLRSMDTSSQMMRSGGVTVELLLDDGGMLASMRCEHPAQLFNPAGWTPEVLRGLRGLDGDLPAPLFVPIQEIEAAGRMSAHDRAAWWRELQENQSGVRPVPCPFVMRFAAPDETTVEERYLRFFHRNPYSAPQVAPGGTISQEEIDRQWESGQVEFQMTAFFEPDVFTLSRALQEWCGDPTQQFPFNFTFGSDPAPTPNTRSVITVIHPGIVDRTWHRMRPVIFEFRPVSRREAYELEATYWRNIGQVERAELAAEIGQGVPNGFTNPPPLTAPNPPPSTQSE